MEIYHGPTSLLEVSIKTYTSATLPDSEHEFNNLSLSSPPLLEYLCASRRVAITYSGTPQELLAALTCNSPKLSGRLMDRQASSHL